MPRPPARFMMSDGHRVIAASAVDHTQVRQLWHGEIAASKPVDDDFTVWVNCPNCSHGAADNYGMIFTCQAMVTRTRRLVEQVKTEHFILYILIATREDLPQKHKRVLCNFIPPKIMSFQVIAIGAESRSAMQ